MEKITMGAPTATASMKDWHKSGWIITASHVLVVVEAPPPPPTAPGELREVSSKDYYEVIEDIVVAKEALEEYEASGVVGTAPYSEYRARRLGTES